MFSIASKITTKQFISFFLCMVFIFGLLPTVFADDTEPASNGETFDIYALENEVIRKSSDNDKYILEDPVDLYRKYAASNERTSLTDPFNMEDPDFMKTISDIALKEAGVETNSALYQDFQTYNTPEEIAAIMNSIVAKILNQETVQMDSMPDIAEIVLAYEPPTAFKYQEWYYKNEIEVLGPDFYYPDMIFYDLIFVTWCADQLGYISHGYFPIAGTSDGLLYDLECRGNKVFKQNDPFVVPQKDDLLFEPDAFGGYKVSIVASCSDGQIATVGCDSSGFAEYHIYELSDIPRDTKFVRLTQISNRHLLSAANFIERALNVKPSVAAAILANMYHESRFSPMALGDAGTSFGLCQWHCERWDALIQFCLENGYDWKSTNGQMHFLIYELSTQDKYVGLVQDMMNCDNSAVGAYQCAYYFCTKYEKPEDAENKADARGVYAYNTIFPMLFSQEMMEQMIEEEQRRLLIDAELQEEIYRINEQAINQANQEPVFESELPTQEDAAAEKEQSATDAAVQEKAEEVKEMIMGNSSNDNSEKDSSNDANNAQVDSLANDTSSDTLAEAAVQSDNID